MTIANVLAVYKTAPLVLVMESAGFCRKFRF
jgi:hypothetical protein